MNRIKKRGQRSERWPKINAPDERGSNLWSELITQPRLQQIRARPVLRMPDGTGVLVDDLKLAGYCLAANNGHPEHLEHCLRAQPGYLGERHPYDDLTLVAVADGPPPKAGGKPHPSYAKPPNPSDTHPRQHGSNDSKSTDFAIHTEEENDDEESISAYPEINEAAFHGPFGQIVKTVESLTEADPAAIVTQLLIGWGNLIGRGPYFSVASDRHYTNLNCCIVGKSGRARKGVSLSVARWILGRIDPDWEKANVRSGLSSGEGLIWQVRDPIVKNEPVKVKGRYTGERQEYVEDEGVTDKRLLIAETEFGSALTVMGRTGNTLSGVVRDAFDSKHRLGTLVKNSPAVATDGHISMIGHITGYELRSRMKECDQWNGFSNRFLWVCAKRHGVLPTPADLVDAGLNEQLRELVATTQWAKNVEEMERDEHAEALWGNVYRAFAEDEEEGIVAATIDRGDVTMLRLSIIYALADGSRIIRLEHVEAAEALWKYAEGSAHYLFGNRLGNPKAEKIFEALRQQPQGLTRREINDRIFKRNAKAELIDTALTLLLKLGWIEQREEPTGGRPAERFYAKK